MWAFLVRRVRTVLIAAVVVPVVSGVAGKIASRVEHAQGGPTLVSRGLRLVESTGRRARRALA